MIHRLVGRQLRNRRHDTERVTGQEHDVGRVAGHALGYVIRDEVNRIGGACVLRDALRVQVDRAGLGIHIYVLEHGPEHFRGCVDLRFALA